MKSNSHIQPVRIIGMGNDYRSDDAVGLHVARGIGRRRLGGTHIIEGISDMAGLLQAWKNGKYVIVIDAVSSKVASGTAYQFDAIHEAIPDDLFTKYSTHTFSLAKSVELARALGMLPEHLMIYGIEGEDFSFGRGLTPRVQKAADRMVKKLSGEIEKILEEAGKHA
jgi:hydrogenase maturation protease